MIAYKALNIREIEVLNEGPSMGEAILVKKLIAWPQDRTYFKYEVGATVVPDQINAEEVWADERKRSLYASNPYQMCGVGIHVARIKDVAGWFTSWRCRHTKVVFECEVAEADVLRESSEKIRCKKVKCLRALTWKEYTALLDAVRPNHRSLRWWRKNYGIRQEEYAYVADVRRLNKQGEDNANK